MNNPFSKKNASHSGRKVRKVSTASGVKANSYVPPTKRRNNKPTNSRKMARVQKLIVRLLIIGVVAAAIMAVAWNNLRINHVIMSSPQAQYIEVIEKYLNRNPAANFKPLVSTSAIAADILNTFPEVASVALEIPFFGERIEVDVVIRKDRLVLKTGEDNYYIVDQEGYAYAKYDVSRGFKGVLILTDDTDVEYGSGATGQFVAPALVEFIQAINKGLTDNEAYKSQAFSYRITDESRVIYVKPSKNEYEIKFQQDISAEQQLYNLNNALDYLKKNSISPLKYIDVRINGTTYYK